ncbi:hypothetical protein [Brevundimonas goettingensis]|uniref:Uncharacterized protein n=1 Tax=Brevundimonas goettingensis TaxID=2774190 RepID=A0A975BZE7_9CAUL|nr:hypothetical protein [Brevundimonas goettingensis]QTC90425.1 hypothetical protein IFJ75_14230 [Brevundimonas goettingensis]
MALRDEGGDDEIALIQSRAVTGRLFESWTVLGDDPDLVQDILRKDVCIGDRFHPGELSPAAVMGLFILLLLAQTPHRR